MLTAESLGDPVWGGGGWHSFQPQDALAPCSRAGTRSVTDFFSWKKPPEEWSVCGVWIKKKNEKVGARFKDLRNYFPEKRLLLIKTVSRERGTSVNH